jgi:hypothetical protein
MNPLRWWNSNIDRE